MFEKVIYKVSNQINFKKNLNFYRKINLSHFSSLFETLYINSNLISQEDPPPPKKKNSNAMGSS